MSNRERVAGLVIDLVLDDAADGCELLASVCEEEQVSQPLAPGYRRSAYLLRNMRGTGAWYDLRKRVLETLPGGSTTDTHWCFHCMRAVRKTHDPTHQAGTIPHESVLEAAYALSDARDNGMKSS